jgi:hypothetical protein
MKRIKRLNIISCLTMAFVAAAFSDSSAHMIIRAEGKVLLEKKGSSITSITGAGERLARGDKLSPELGARVVVFCDEVKAWTVPSGVKSSVSFGCPKFDRVIQLRSGGDIRPGGNNPDIPYIVYPRMTFLLNETPHIRWNRVKGANAYTVQVLGLDGVMWQKTTKTTEATYDKTAEALEWGINYRIVVEADNKTSSLEDAGACYGFKLVDGDLRQKIQQKSAKITDLVQLNAEEKALARAYLYESNNLISEAIQALEEYVGKQKPSALVYRELGGLYAIAGLNLLAQDFYSRSMNQYTAVKNEYGLARTQAELSAVKLMLQKQSHDPRECDQIFTPQD